MNFKVKQLIEFLQKHNPEDCLHVEKQKMQTCDRYILSTDSNLSGEVLYFVLDADLPIIQALLEEEERNK